MPLLRERPSLRDALRKAEAEERQKLTLLRTMETLVTEWNLFAQRVYAGEANLEHFLQFQSAMIDTLNTINLIRQELE